LFYRIGQFSLSLPTCQLASQSKFIEASAGPEHLSDRVFEQAGKSYGLLQMLQTLRLWLMGLYQIVATAS
jgi:hypothetical protein